MTVKVETPVARETKAKVEAPLALLAELSHRCPLQCPYCSNPVNLERASNELDTKAWLRVLDEAAEMGVHQVHFSGGEPTVRKDLEDLVQHANKIGLYSNLITSAVMLTKEKLSALADAGLCHVQIRFQGNEPGVADRVAGLKNAHEKKIEDAKWTRELDLPLTVNDSVLQYLSFFTTARGREVVERGLERVRSQGLAAHRPVHVGDGEEDELLARRAGAHDGEPAKAAPTRRSTSIIVAANRSTISASSASVLV